jgi:cyanophycinase
VHALASAGAEPVWLPLDGALRRALDGGLCAQLPALYNGFANTAAGAPPIWHPERQFPDLAARQRAACEDPAQHLDAQLRGLHGIFFSGGDQARLLEAFLSRDDQGRYTVASRQLQILRERHAAGRLVVAGSSAGNSAQAGGLWQGQTVPMIGGGDSPRVLAGGFRQGPGPVPEAGAREGLGYAEGGLGFFSLGPLDSHFSERGREGRLLRYVADSRLPYGFGVDENTALLVRRNGKATHLQVSGAGGVFIVDARQARRGDGPAYTLQGARVHYLHAGDEAQVDAQGRLQVRLRGAPLPAQPGAAAPQRERVEQRLGFVQLTRQMGRDGASAALGLMQPAPTPQSEAAGPAFALRLQRDAATTFAAHGGERISYRDLRVDIEPVAR